MPSWLITTLVVIAAVILLFLIAGYLKAPPDTAYIISGPFKKRILIGKAGWRMPFFERVDKIWLELCRWTLKRAKPSPRTNL